jgi:hypothetical protein
MTTSFKTLWREYRKAEVKFYLQIVILEAKQHMIFKALTKDLEHVNK